MNTRRILVLAADASTTKPSASDSDELGVELGIEFAARLQRHPLYDSEQLTVIGDTELRLEHALGLQPCDLAVFVDACADIGDSIVFQELQLEAGHHLESMNGKLTSLDLMHALKTLARQHEIPTCFRLTAKRNGENTVQEDALEAAMQLMEQLLHDADPEHWRRLSNTGVNQAV